MGSSSTFTVGLLNSLFAAKKKLISKRQLADNAIKIGKKLGDAYFQRAQVLIALVEQYESLEIDFCDKLIYDIALEDFNNASKNGNVPAKQYSEGLEEYVSMPADWFLSGIKNNELSPSNKICQDIINGRISCWIIFNTDTGKEFLLEKSPPNIIRTRFLQAMFPNSYFINIKRHPIATSLATKKWSKTSLDSKVILKFSSISGVVICLSNWISTQIVSLIMLLVYLNEYSLPKPYIHQLLSLYQMLYFLKQEECQFQLNPNLIRKL